jgi:hypothetical protein
MHSFVVFEAGATDDTRSLIKYLGKDNYLNPPPEAVKNIKVRTRSVVISSEGIDVFTLQPLRTEDLKANEPIIAYLRASCEQLAKWVYISGHTGTYGYSGDMSTDIPAGQGHAHYTFDDGEFFLTDDGVKAYGEKIDTTRIASSCVAIVVMGCAIIQNQHHTNNLQRTFSSAGGQDRPIILGWADACPAESSLKDLVLKTFVNKVKATAGLVDSIDLTSRDTLVRLWGEVAVKIHPGLGARDKDQNVWKLRPVQGQSDKNKWSTAP